MCLPPRGVTNSLLICPSQVGWGCTLASFSHKILSIRAVFARPRNRFICRIHCWAAAFATLAVTGLAVTSTSLWLIWVLAPNLCSPPGTARVRGCNTTLPTFIGNARAIRTFCHPKMSNRRAFSIWKKIMAELMYAARWSSLGHGPNLSSGYNAVWSSAPRKKSSNCPSVIQSNACNLNMLQLAMSLSNPLTTRSPSHAHTVGSKFMVLCLSLHFMILASTSSSSRSPSSPPRAWGGMMISRNLLISVRCVCLSTWKNNVENVPTDERRKTSRTDE